MYAKMDEYGYGPFIDDLPNFTLMIFNGYVIEGQEGNVG